MRTPGQPTDHALLGALAGWLERERLKRNVTQAELAHEAGVSKRTVERLEAGDSVQLASLLRVLRALQLTHQLQALLPEASVTPMERLRGEGRARKRASAPRPSERNNNAGNNNAGNDKTKSKTKAWSWDDDT